MKTRRTEEIVIKHGIALSVPNYPLADKWKEFITSSSILP